MSQAIAPLGTPQSCRFEKRSKNDLLMKIRVNQVEISIFQAIPSDQMDSLLNLVLSHDHKIK